MSVAAILIAIVAGNLGAVVAPPLNTGLFWNSVAGATGAALLLILRQIFLPGLEIAWYLALILSAIAGFLAMLLAGALTALKYRS